MSPIVTERLDSHLAPLLPHFRFSSSIMILSKGEYQMNKIIENYVPQDGGTVVKQVDKDGKLTGKEFRSTSWNTRFRPDGITGGCPRWLNQIVVADALEGANKGKNLIPPNSSTATIASSSPSSRDVTAVYVDSNGTKIREFRVPYVFVPYSQPSNHGTGWEIANEIWFSDSPFDPKTTKIDEAEAVCNAAPPVA